MLTDIELQQVFDYFRSKGTDFDPNLDLSSIDQSQWDKIFIIARDTSGPAARAGNVTLKKILDVYGGDLAALKADIIAAVKRQETASLGALTTQQTSSVQAVKTAETESVKVVKDALTALDPKIVAAETAAKTATDKAAECVNSETKCNTVLNEVQRIYQDISTGEIFGLDYNTATSKGVRTGAASGLTFRRWIGNKGAIQQESDFRTIGPWGNIYQVLRSVDGNRIVARTGDENFEAALRSGECNLFTHIPKYFVKIETPEIDGQIHWIINVSSRPFAGSFSFITGDFIEIASCVTSSKGGKHVSQPDCPPLVETQGYTFEEKAETQGLHNIGWKDRLALLVLSWVETGSLNSQNSIGAGVSSGFPFSWGDAGVSQVKEASSGATNTVVVKKQNFKVGMLIYIGTNYYNGALGKRHVTGYREHAGDPALQDVDFDGNPIATTTSHWVTACSQDVSPEAILEMGTRPGYYRPDDTWSEGQCHAFLYGVCDPWGNIFQVTSGIAKYNDKLFLTHDRTRFTREASLPQPGWDEVDAFSWLGEGYPSKWRMKKTHDNLSLVPTALGGDTSKMFGDYLWGAADGIRVPWVGGYWLNGSHGGAFYLYWNTASNSYIDYGARFVYE